jgi:3',5'-cyclic-AMP phosphodiesterase
MIKRIAHITDTHFNDTTALGRGIDPKQNFTAILERVAEIGVDEIVCTGDIGEPETYKWFFKKMEKYKPGFKITLGNHDDYHEAVKFFSQKTMGDGELYYSIEEEFFKHIFMDSASGTISDAQLNWLKDEMATLKKVIVFIHHPVLGFETGMDRIYPLKNRDEVAAILQTSNQPVNVFCGHYHMPDKRTQGKLTQYITPAVSFQVKKFSPTIEIKAGNFGFRLITLTETAVTTQLYTNNYNYFSPTAL